MTEARSCFRSHVPPRDCADSKLTVILKRHLHTRCLLLGLAAAAGFHADILPVLENLSQGITMAVLHEYMWLVVVGAVRFLLPPYICSCCCLSIAYWQLSDIAFPFSSQRLALDGELVCQLFSLFSPMRPCVRLSKTLTDQFALQAQMT